MSENKKSPIEFYMSRLDRDSIDEWPIQSAFKAFQNELFEVYSKGPRIRNFDYTKLNYLNKKLYLPECEFSYSIGEDFIKLTKMFNEQELSYDIFIYEKYEGYDLTDINKSDDQLKRIDLFSHDNLEACVKAGLNYLLLKTKREINEMK
jgi:hypothetical protein